MISATLAEKNNKVEYIYRIKINPHSPRFIFFGKGIDPLPVY